MDYMYELRQVVGNRPLIMVGATLLVLNQDNQLLMIKRTDNKCWGVPGGAMELGENLENTVRRETQEEIDLEIRNLELFGVYSGQELYYKYPNGAEVYNVSVVYLTRDVSETIKVNPDEHSEYRYFDIQNLPTEISPPIKPILRDLASREGLKIQS
jgi:ADP-ribose pyrophosphatase YjhB (NUDIX family)